MLQETGIVLALTQNRVLAENDTGGRSSLKFRLPRFAIVIVHNWSECRNLQMNTVCR